MPLHLGPDLFWHLLNRVELGCLEGMARALCRLGDNVPHLMAFWTMHDQQPLRRSCRLPGQDRGPASVSLTLLPPQDDARDDEL